MMSWEAYYNDARRYDEELEVKLNILEKAAYQTGSSNAGANHGNGGNSRGVNNSSQQSAEAQRLANFNILVQEVQSLQRSLQQMVQSMSDLSQQSGDPSHSRRTKYMMEVLREKEAQQLRFIRDGRRRLESAALVSNVHTRLKHHEDSKALRDAMDEKESIMAAVDDVTTIIDVGRDTKSRMDTQRKQFVDISNKVVGIIEKAPVVSGLLKRIDAKRRREVIILSFCMALCLFFIIIFW